MPTVSDIMQQLEKLGTAQTRKTFARHGAPVDRMFGVKVGDLKPILKKLRGQQELAMQLYATGNSDAMYLAGLVADGSQMTKKQLNDWAKQASWYMIGEYTVPGVASESRVACELARKWIDAKQPSIASCGWATWSAIVATKPDEELDLREIQSLLDRVVKQIESAPNRVRYTMNAFVISVGTYVAPLLDRAKEAARKIGKVQVDVGNTACRVPLASDYIAKVESMNRVGRKRKTMKC
ncbi:MAG: DNA alkylation repair protein [Planctomycetaceae bacterium]